jgi:hypothetical protein
MHRNTRNPLNKRSRWDNPAVNQQNFYPSLNSYQRPPQPPPASLPIYQPCDVFSLRDSGPLLKTPEQNAFVSNFFIVLDLLKKFLLDLENIL